MKNLLISLTLFLTLNLITYSQEKLEMEGAIKIGISEAVSPVPGTIQWKDSDLVVKIGGKEWMAENLCTSKSRDGTSISQITDNTAWAYIISGAWCWYNNDNRYDQPYGKLYNWYAVDDSRGLCPAGWHVPIDASDWTTLANFLGSRFVAGGPMKEVGTAHWNSPNTGVTNASGFTGLGAGFRSGGGTFWYLGVYSYWWSTTESSSSKAWARELYYNNAEFTSFSFDKKYGFSVRCVKD